MTPILCALALAGAPSLPPLSVSGKNLVDPSGNTVVLKGANLGNWFVIEPWMLARATGFEDQHALEKVLADRFGAAAKDRLMEAFRESWLTDRDFQMLRGFGFNVVRLPLNYRQFEDDKAPKRLRPDAWKWVDRAIDLAERHGMYTILDMHGVQGGQSVYDHTGHAGQNKLWTVAENQDRLAWLWGEIAKRYRDRPAVAAYDLINEPYGGSKDQQLAVFDRLVKAVRAVDPDTLVYVHGNWDGFDHYGDPKERGWANTGFTMHYYPGLFGFGSPSPLTHARHLARLEEVAKQVDRLNVPFLVGEMNVVFRRAGGAAMMRRTFDAHRRFGWATTMWCAKAISTEGGHGEATWGAITNAKPARSIDVRTATQAQIEAYFRGFATEELVEYRELREMLTADNPELPPLPEIPEPIRTAPPATPLPGWQSTDVADARPGAVVVEGEDWVVYGGGDDIWGQRDQFHFVHRAVSGDFRLEAELLSLDEVDSYSKAGLMVRAGLDADAPTALLSVFPTGERQIAIRSARGATMDGRPGVVGALPVRLALERKGDTLRMLVWQNGAWNLEGETTLASWPPGALQVGLVSLSHDNSQLGRARYRNVKLTP